MTINGILGINVFNFNFNLFISVKNRIINNIGVLITEFKRNNSCNNGTERNMNKFNRICTYNYLFTYGKLGQLYL